MEELIKIFKTEFESIEAETEARIKAFQEAIAAGKKLLSLLDEDEWPTITCEIDQCGDEMTCIPSYVDENAIIFDDKKTAEWIPVENLLKALIYAGTERDALFVGIAPGQAYVITKAIAQRILEPFLKSEEYDKSDEARLSQAIVFAASAHLGQYRKGTNTPYIVHPLEVMIILQSMDADTNLMIAGLLHDVVEDTDVTIATIEKRFGFDVAALVAAHTENKNWRWENRKKNCICETEYGSDRFKMLILADTVSNQRAMLHDLALEGDKVWERFHRGRDMQAWYYGAKQDALRPMAHNDKTKKVYWEMVDDFKDIFAEYYLNVSNHKIYQISPEQSFVFDAVTGNWDKLSENEKVKGIQITRNFAETIEDAWSLKPESKRQWKEWMFFDEDEPTSEELVKMIVEQLKAKGVIASAKESV